MQLTRYNSKYRDITIALAGVFQASMLVNQLATTGKIDQLVFNQSIKTIFKLEAQDTLAVFDGISSIRHGLEEIIKVFEKKNRKIKLNSHITRYALSLILLQHKLLQNKKMMADIRKRIELACSQERFFSEVNNAVIANLADIYFSTVSSFSFRIHLLGKVEFLQNQSHLDKIRALLLAGIRAAVLWRQVGGRRWQLFLSRKIILKIAKELLREIDQISKNQLVNSF